MHRFQLKTDNTPVNINLGVAVRRPSKVKVKVVNPNKRNTSYIDRWNTVKKRGEFEIRMPQNCKKAILLVGSMDVPDDDNVRITKLQKEKLKQYVPCINGNKNVKEFLNFAQQFSENCGVISPQRLYSNKNTFTIDFLPQIKDSNGKVLKTPARIHNKTGRMEVSKKHFDRMTVPMRMAILCHEYSHFHLNEVQNDEIEADLNGLKLYLGKGYPVIEAHKAFLNVFKRSKSQQNKKRYEYLKTFIDNFDKWKYSICLP